MRFQVLMSFTMGTSGQVALQLGATCGHDMDCQDSIKQSQCSMTGLCECKPYYAQFNETSCVQGEFRVPVAFFFFFFYLVSSVKNLKMFDGWPRIRIYARSQAYVSVAVVQAPNTRWTLCIFSQQHDVYIHSLWARGPRHRQHWNSLGGRQEWRT